MKPENGFLKFDVRPEFIPEKLKELYIRKAYGDLFQIICNNLNSDNEAKRRFHSMAIAGTQGIGKGVFLFYILWKLANMETIKTVILHRQIEHEIIYVFQGSGCWDTFDSNDIVAFLEDPTIWYLTDSLTPSPTLANAIIILVSPPLRKYLSDRSKDPSIPSVHYLTTWSLEEPKRAAHVYLKFPEEVEKRFCLMGGIARYVLEEDRDLGAPINEAIKMQLLGKHWLASLEVEPPHCTECKIVAFSGYVKERLLEKLRDRPDKELESYASYFKEDLPFARSLVERWFANCANR